MNNMPEELISATIDRIEATVAVLKLFDGQELKVSLSYLPPGVQEGAVVVLHFTENQDIERQHQQRARHLLNQILKPN